MSLMSSIFVPVTRSLIAHRISGLSIVPSWRHAHTSTSIKNPSSSHPPTPAPTKDELHTPVDDPIASEVHLTTRNQIEGRIIVEEFGIVVGAAARSKNILHDLWARIKGIIGGRLPAYEVMLANTSAIATRNAMEEAKRLGANQLVRVRYQANATESKLTGVSCFCLCYATAVRSIDIEEYELLRRAGMIGESTSSGNISNSSTHHRRTEAD